MTLIEILAKLNWFEAADSTLRALAGVRSHKLAIWRACGWSGQQMQDMLKSYGVKIWNRGFTEETLTFRVKDDQANWAEYLLNRHGIPVVSRPINPRNVEAYGRGMVPHWNQGEDDRDEDWLDLLLS